MDYKNNNFEVLRNEMGLSNRDFSKHLDVAEQSYTKLKKGIYPLGRVTLQKIEKAFPDINLDWLLYNKGEREKQTNIITSNNLTTSSNAKYIGQFSEDVIYKDDEGYNIFFEISPGRYLMKTKLVTEKAKAGYLCGYDSQEYIEELPSHTITVSEFHKGKYMSFEVFGDSMDNGKRGCIGHGDIVTGRSIDQIYWRSKLHTHSWDFWVLVTKNEGILVKQIIKHDVENGILTLHSLNEDKSKYPDFDIKLDDVSQIFNVVDIHMKL